jgi:hypothetical protein
MHDIEHSSVQEIGFFTESLELFDPAYPVQLERAARNAMFAGERYGV